VKRLLVPSAALLWGLQFAFLNPALALLLVALFDATPAEVGWVLVVYNASGFVASLVLPAYADRTADYLRPMLACALLTLALAALLAVTTSLADRRARPARARRTGRGRQLAHVIPRPGLASALLTNTRRVGAIVSGPIIGFGSATALGYGGVIAVCAALKVVALAAMVVAGRTAPPRLSAPVGPPPRRGSRARSARDWEASPT
jgi:SET family sugar efflux transporter-like MFS transporter